ncbi:hypothetical protein [Amedibacillus dolichus]|uniref:Uncharacterized protein n=1 Tax=Amedibacillus dolichus DSM 3991 TaxID=428127 RepID=A8RCZ3_9FIRM|nr:hypothetical protein [Amedibacillus dolichus]EDP10945.1 hypothetical protein EUBDOL_01544 [Amedibacillus dolichus DSM 3991]
MKKYKTWTEESASRSIYFNWDFIDKALKDEFETEVGYVSQYLIRLSDHERPPVIDGYATYEHKFFYDARDEETYILAVKYLTAALDKYCDGKINAEELGELLFNVNYNDLMELQLKEEVK